MKVLKNVFVLVGVLALSACNLNPTKIADDYFNVLYDSDSYKVEVKEDGINFFLNNLNDIIEEMKEITSPYVTEEQSNSFFAGLKIAVTSVIFSIVENEYEFSVEDTEYSLNENDSDENNKYYDYSISIKLVDKNGEETLKNFAGVIHLKKVDNKWKINNDTLTNYNLS